MNKIKILLSLIICANINSKNPQLLDASIFNTTQKLLEQLYEGINAFNISHEETTQISNCGGSPVYGEATDESVRDIANLANLGPNDIFYDFGCGRGKVNVIIYLISDVKKSIGVELSKTRCNQAESIKTELQKHKLIDKHRELEFKNDNFLDIDCSDATVIYMCSTCFPQELMEKLTKKFAKLKPGTQIISLKKLASDPAIEFIKLEHKPMTWSSSTPVHFYRIK